MKTNKIPLQDAHIVYFDGGKPAAGKGITFGYVLKGPTGEVIHKYGGNRNDNSLTTNDAEYIGLIEAISYCLRQGIRKTSIVGDSALIVSQIKGTYRVKAKHLKVHHAVAKELLANFEEYEINWVRREHNSEADAMCR